MSPCMENAGTSASKGLERFFTTGNKAGIQAKHAERLRLILGGLNAATSARDMALPALELHELRGAPDGHVGREGER